MRLSRNAALLLLLVPPSVRASFQAAPESPRTVSLARASAVFPNEAASLFLNSAGLAALKSGEVSFMYDKGHAGMAGVGLSRGYVAAAYPLSFATLGVGFGTFRASGLKDERTIALGAARSLGERFEAGVTLKHLSHGYALGSDPRDTRDPVFRAGTSKSAVAFDAGLTALLHGPLKGGVALRNLNQPDVGLTTEDRVPREVAAGLGLDFPERSFRLVGEAALRDEEFGHDEDRVLVSVGLEKGLGERFTMRFGASQLELTGGFGVRFGRARFDYGLVLIRNLLADSMGSHRIGVSLEFGAPKAGTGGSGARELLRGAIEAVRDGQLDLAVVRMRRALEADPDDKSLARKLQRLRAAANVMPHVVGGEAHMVLVRRAVIAYLEGGDLKQVIVTLRQAHNTAPDEARVLSLLNVVEREAGSELTRLSLEGVRLTFVERKTRAARQAVLEGQLPSAIKRADEALEVDPRSVMALQIKGSAYYLLGDRKEARRTWERALELDPDNAELKKVLGGDLR